MQLKYFKKMFQAPPSLSFCQDLAFDYFVCNLLRYSLMAYISRTVLNRVFDKDYPFLRPNISGPPFYHDRFSSTPCIENHVDKFYLEK